MKFQIKIIFMFLKYSNKIIYILNKKQYILFLFLEFINKKFLIKFLKIEITINSLIFHLDFKLFNKN